MFSINNSNWFPTFGMPTTKLNSHIGNNIFNKSLSISKKGKNFSTAKLSDVTHFSSENFVKFLPAVNQKVEAFVQSLKNMNLQSTQQKAALFSQKCKEWASIVHDLEKLEKYDQILSLSLLFIDSFEPQLLTSLASTPHAPLVLKVIKYSFFAARMTGNFAQLGNHLNQFCKNDSSDNTLNIKIITTAVKCLEASLKVHSSQTFKSLLNCLPTWPKEIVDNLALKLGDTESIQTLSLMYDRMHSYIKQPSEFLSDAQYFQSNYSTVSEIAQNHLANQADQIVSFCIENKQYDKAFQLISSLAQSLPMQSLGIILKKGVSTAYKMGNKFALKAVLESALYCFLSDSDKGKDFFKTVIESSEGLNLKWKDLVIKFCKEAIVEGIVDAKSPLYEMFSEVVKQSPYVEYLVELAGGYASNFMEQGSSIYDFLSSVAQDSELSNASKKYILDSLDKLIIGSLDEITDKSKNIEYLENIFTYYEKCGYGSSNLNQKMLEYCATFQDHHKYINYFKRWRKSKPGDHYIQKEAVASTLLTLYQKSQKTSLTKKEQVFISQIKEWVGFSNDLDILTPEGQDLLWGKTSTYAIAKEIQSYNKNMHKSTADFIHLINKVDQLLMSNIIPEDMPIRKECDALLRNQLQMCIQKGQDFSELLAEVSSSTMYANSPALFDFVFNTENNLGNKDKAQYINFILANQSENKGLFQLALTKINHLLLHAEDVDYERVSYNIETFNSEVIGTYKNSIDQLNLAWIVKENEREVELLCQDPQLLVNKLGSINRDSTDLEKQTALAALQKMVQVCIQKSEYALADQLIQIASQTVYSQLPLDLYLDHLSIQMIINPSLDALENALKLLKQSPRNMAIVERCIFIVSQAVQSDLHEFALSNIVELMDEIDYVLDHEPQMQILPSIQNYKTSKMKLSEVKIEAELMQFAGSGSILADFVSQINSSYQDTLPSTNSEEKNLSDYFRYICSKLDQNQQHSLSLKVSKELEKVYSQFDPQLLYSIMLTSAINSFNDKMVIYANVKLAESTGANQETIQLLDRAFSYFYNRGNLEQMQKVANKVNELIEKDVGSHITLNYAQSLIEKLDEQIHELQQVYAYYDKDIQAMANEIGLTDGLHEAISQLAEMSSLNSTQDKKQMQGFIKYLVASEGMSEMLNEAYSKALKSDLLTKEELQLLNDLRQYVYKQQPNKLNEMIDAKESLYQVLISNEIQHSNKRLLVIESQFQLLQSDPELALQKFFPNISRDQIDQNILNQCINDFSNTYYKTKQSLQSKRLISIYEENHKVGLDELLSVQSLCNLESFFSTLKNLGINPDLSQHKPIEEAILNSQEFMYRSSETRSYGDLTFTNIKRYKEVTGKEITAFDDIFSKISAHGHAAIIDTSSGELSYTHLTDSFSSKAVSLEAFLTDDAYRIDLMSMTSLYSKSVLMELNQKLIEKGLSQPLESPEDLLQELYACQLNTIFNGPISSSTFVNEEDRLEFLLTKESLGIQLTQYEEALLRSLKKNIAVSDKLNDFQIVDLSSVDESIYMNSLYDSKVDQVNTFYHQQTQFGSITNTESMQYNAVNILPKQAYRDLKNKVTSLFYQKTNPTTDSFANLSIEGGMICSAFQVKVTLKALAMLNQNLNELCGKYLDNRFLHKPEELITVPVYDEIDWSKMTPMKSLELFKDSLHAIDYTEDFYSMTSVNSNKFKPISPSDRSLLQKGYIKFF